MSYRLAKYDPKYLQGVLELQRNLWTDSVDLNAEYFAWKHDQNPYLDNVPIYLALECERVVGMRGLIGARWCVGGSESSFVAPCAGDTVVAPDHRRKGLMREIFRFIAADEALARFPYLLNFSAGEAVYACQLREGWHAAGSYDTAMRSHGLLEQPLLRGSWALARRVLGKATRQAILRAANRAAGRGAKGGPAPLSRSDRPRPHDMARLVRETDCADQIGHVRDEAYYAWRFRSPLSSYRFYYWQEESLQGFLVTQQGKHSAGAAINIVEWQGANESILRDLLLAAIRGAGINRVAIWTATLPDVFAGLLQGQSFEKPAQVAPSGGFRPSMMMTCLNESLATGDSIPDFGTFSDIDRWNLRMTFSDAH